MAKPIKTQAYNFQIDPRMLKRAKELVDLPTALREYIQRLVDTSICPVCGSELKKKGRHK